MYNFNSNRHPNFFGDHDINRQANLRKDKEWILKRLKSNRSIVIPVINSQILIKNGDVPEIVNFKTNQFPDAKIEDFILLGEFNGQTYFTIALKNINHQEDTELYDLKKIASLLDKSSAALLAFATGIVHWQETHLYCGKCGSKTIVEEAGHLRTCKNKSCRNKIFPRTDPAIITLVLNNNACLLGRNDRWPKGVYSTLAGFVEPGESLEEAVKREVLEETGVIIKEAYYHSSQPWPFPSSIMLGFISIAENRKLNINYNELEDARWFVQSELLDMIEKKKILLPNKFSIANRLITEWLYT